MPTIHCQGLKLKVDLLAIVCKGCIGKSRIGIYYIQVKRKQEDACWHHGLRCEK